MNKKEKSWAECNGVGEDMIEEAGARAADTEKTRWSVVFRDDGLISPAAEGFLAPVCHEGFDLFHAARDAGEQLHAVRRHRNVVLDADLERTQTFWWVRREFFSDE